MSTCLNILLVALSIIIISEGCSDSASNCVNWVANGFCKSSFYSYSEKKSKCAMSCGFCGSTSTSSGSATSSSSCSDKLTTCGYWAANGFCTNSFYNSTIRAQWCPNTCGLCSSSSTTDSSTSESTSEATSTT